MGVNKPFLLKPAAKDSLWGGSSVVIRPSGTEPKLKAYVSVTAGRKAEAIELEAKFVEDFERWLHSFIRYLSPA